MVVLVGNLLWAVGLERSILKYIQYISVYARTDRCYNERGSRNNYVRSSIPNCTYKRNINEGSCNHCCHGKATSITYYSECVSVALVIHSMQSACAVSSSAVCPVVSYFSTLCHNRHDFRGEGGGGSYWIQRRVSNFVLTKK